MHLNPAAPLSFSSFPLPSYEIIYFPPPLSPYFFLHHPFPNRLLFSVVSASSRAAYLLFFHRRFWAAWCASRSRLIRNVEPSKAPLYREPGNWDRVENTSQRKSLSLLDIPLCVRQYVSRTLPLFSPFSLSSPISPSTLPPSHNSPFNLWPPSETIFLRAPSAFSMDSACFFQILVLFSIVHPLFPSPSSCISAHPASPSHPSVIFHRTPPSHHPASATLGHHLLSGDRGPVWSAFGSYDRSTNILGSIEIHLRPKGYHCSVNIVNANLYKLPRFSRQVLDNLHFR